MEQTYELLKLFYKIKKGSITNIPAEYIGDIENSIEYCEIERILLNKEQIYCPNCGGLRKHNLCLKYDSYTGTGAFNEMSHMSILGRCKRDSNAPTNYEEFKNFVYKNLVETKRIILILGCCLQCENEVVINIYNENDEINMVKLYECGGGTATQNTPESVKYYLDEAFKCKTMGAYTGAVAMYRTALENLLYDKGYQKGMLKDKIKAFEKEKEDNTAPRWADVVDEDILDKIRDLGNWAVHPNKGDITKQQHLQDEELIECLDDVFKYLLDEIYEKEIKKSSLLETLKKKKKDLNNIK